MRRTLAALMLIVAPAAAQVPGAAGVRTPAPTLPAQQPYRWNPAAAYITAGQDEAGYRSWYLAAPWRPAQVKSFNAYLAAYQVSGIVPTWQLLRTATSWQRCGGAPFEVPPTSEWPHIVQTLRYVNDYVIPALGPVEPVSGYRNPALNSCAGGAPSSAHKHYSAIDMVPLRAITREQLIRTLCAVHARRGTDYHVGLGFYAFLRFHVDTTKYRRWGTDSSMTSACPPIIRPEDVASVALPPPQPTPAPGPTRTPSPTSVAPLTAVPAPAPAPAPARVPEPALARPPAAGALPGVLADPLAPTPEQRTQ
jgi:hypothetical protein